MTSNSLSIVIPVFNSEAILPVLVGDLRQVLTSLAAHYEVVLVNDCSTDGSWEVICQLAREYEWVRGLNLMRNYGQHNALLCGIRHAKYEVIITMDDDLQHPPEEISKLLEKLEEGHDVVYGTPLKEQHGFMRDIASVVTKLVLQNAMGAETARKVCAFRAFRARLRDAFVGYHGPFVSIDVLLTWATTRFTSVQVVHNPRRQGISNYTFSKLFTHAFNMMTGFTTLPLQVASLIGFLFTLFGIGVLSYVIGKYILLGYSVPGFPFLASIIAIFSGAQLFALGIIGEYLARVHFRTMEKPAFVVRSVTSDKAERKNQDRA